MQPFSFDTINNFDEHIMMSIPNYDLLIDTVRVLSDYFKVDNTNIYDLGCGTGKFIESIEFNGIKIGVDSSVHLLPHTTDVIRYEKADLNNIYSMRNACLVYALFILQFLTKTGRINLLHSIYDGLIDGGAVFIAEKVYEAKGNFQDIFHSAFYTYKLRSFSPDEILGKEQDLRLLLRPYTTDELMTDIEKAGFTKVALFFKFLNFCGWLCIK